MTFQDEGEEMNGYGWVVCLFKGHKYEKWRANLIPGAQVPWAYCDRCGKEA